MRIYIYSRKSVYTGKGESVENQIEMCREYISAKIPESDKAEIVVYEDEGFSAKNTNRPQFQKMLRDIKLNKPEYMTYFSGNAVRLYCRLALMIHLILEKSFCKNRP